MRMTAKTSRKRAVVVAAAVADATGAIATMGMSNPLKVMRTGLVETLLFPMETSLQEMRLSKTHPSLMRHLLNPLLNPLSPLPRLLMRQTQIRPKRMVRLVTVRRMKMPLLQRQILLMQHRSQLMLPHLKASVTQSMQAQAKQAQALPRNRPLTHQPLPLPRASRRQQTPQTW